MDRNLESKYIEIYGSKMHYTEWGEGDPILFLHGNPTSSYLWRDVIREVKSLGRCIAVDLIGMGKSDKPKLKYSFWDHYKYLAEFIYKMKLKNITLVLHDWGSGLGFHYFSENESNIKGLVFMEALVKPFNWSDISYINRIIFKLFRTPVIGWILLVPFNFFINILLPKMIRRKLSDNELSNYKEPFKKVRDRKPVYMWPREVPFNKKPLKNYKMMSDYSKKLQVSNLPKLLLYVTPGAIITKKWLIWCQENIKNLKSVHVGDGLHYIQEDNPKTIGEEIVSWYNQLWIK